MKVLVTGANGQLGLEIARQAPDWAPLEVVAVGRDECDLTQSEQVRSVFDRHFPQVVINAAAYTAVDLAETEREACRATNVTGVENLARLCQERDARLIQISSDYVFENPPAELVPRREDDVANPTGVYALSKLQGECVALEECENTCVVRTCGLYDRLSEQRTHNFAKTMLRLAAERDVLKVVADQTCTPTFVGDLAPALRFLCSHSATGVLHVTNAGEVAWCDFARKIFELKGLEIEVEPITTAEFGAAAPRPRYSVLDGSRYAALDGPAMRPWQEALEAALGS